MNHKRRRPKNRRAGCLFCKPWKGNGCKSKGHKREERKLQRQYEGEAALHFVE